MNIREALIRRAKELCIPLPRLLQLYAMERFLFRLARSPVADKLYLKGGMLLMGFGIRPSRTTMDIDLLGKMSNSKQSVQHAIQSIIHVKPGVSDGVTFSDKLSISDIIKDALYVGVRVEFFANVVGEQCPMKVDIGFSDEVYPHPMDLDYPATLPQLPGARLKVYSRESMVAEKWQALVQLKQMNSRMKDIYDLWFFSKNFSFDYNFLCEAIRRTFVRRNTNPADFIFLSSPTYLEAQQPEWAAYVRKMKATFYRSRSQCSLPSRYLDEVMSDILRWLSPVMNEGQFSTWDPKSGQWDVNMRHDKTDAET